MVDPRNGRYAEAVWLQCKSGKVLLFLSAFSFHFPFYSFSTVNYIDNLRPLVILGGRFARLKLRTQRDTSLAPHCTPCAQSLLMHVPRCASAIVQKHALRYPL